MSPLSVDSSSQVFVSRVESEVMLFVFDSVPHVVQAALRGQEIKHLQSINELYTLPLRSNFRLWWKPTFL